MAGDAVSARGSGKSNAPNGEDYSAAARVRLRESIRQARELRSANLALTQQISQSLRRLTEQCDALSSLSNQVTTASVHLPGPARSPAEAGSSFTEAEARL